MPRHFLPTRHLLKKWQGWMVAASLSWLMLAPPGRAEAPTKPPGEPVWVGRFADGLAPWREVQIKPELPRNRFRLRDWDGATALEVLSEGAMSLMARPLAVDLKATPILCWRWRVSGPLSRADMTQRSGDDHAARVYVSLSIPLQEQGFGLRTQLRLARALWGSDVPDAAINYVWDNRQPVGTEMPNAYTDRAVMVVLRSGSAEAGHWVWERRDVAQDAARLFGASARPVQLAVTVDTDNTQDVATSGFADFHFVAANARCVAR